MFSSFIIIMFNTCSVTTTVEPINHINTSRSSMSSYSVILQSYFHHETGCSVLIMVKEKYSEDSYAVYGYGKVKNVHMWLTPPASGCHNDGDN